jgi:hypothetical protein
MTEYSKNSVLSRHCDLSFSCRQARQAAYSVASS